MSDDIDNFMPYLEEAASKVSFVLELGIGKGTGSTLAFTRGLKRNGLDDKCLISVDRLDYMELKPNVPWWHLVIGDSTSERTFDAVAQLASRPPDIIFIDTHHTEEQVSGELGLWQYMATEHTVWLFHDTYMMGAYNPMVDAIKEFAAAYHDQSINGWEYEDISTEPHGLGKMFKP